MNCINLEELISPKFIEPTFYVNFHSIERPRRDCLPPKLHKDKANFLICWKVEDKQLIKVEEENNGIFFDGESYIVQWSVKLKTNDISIEQGNLVNYWKGQNAAKCYTPLPPEIDEQCSVERIGQWSEPAIFFYSFQKLIVFFGKQDTFDCKTPHLLMARGELLEEIHFYEVPCKRSSLRSRGNFLLIIPEKQSFLYWHGSQTSARLRLDIVSLFMPHYYLKKWQTDWSNFLILEQEEGKEESNFLDTVKGDDSDFIHVQLISEFTPKLFYLNSVTGNFLATEIEYPLRAEDEVAAFPFLQSHLYTALQPALFLLDNDSELWLWEGIKSANCDNKAFEEQLKLAKALQEQYAKEKEKLTSRKVKCPHIIAYKEPLEFKNIFPLWF